MHYATPRLLDIIYIVAVIDDARCKARSSSLNHVDEDSIALCLACPASHTTGGGANLCPHHSGRIGPTGKAAVTSDVDTVGACVTFGAGAAACSL